MKIELKTIKIGQPAHRALQNAGIDSLEQLAKYSEDELLSLHGFGPKALNLLIPHLAELGLTFRKTGK